VIKGVESLTKAAAKLGISQSAQLLPSFPAEVPEHVRIELLVECDAVEALPTSVGCACSHCYQ